ncbi:hypothetical protein [Sphingobium sp.]|jgi:hypothetical protein|uniref:hypothetical protein n=1 Tax=Sphingobium sp. TaxID=1912891 RepID=UPI003BB5DF6A
MTTAKQIIAALASDWRLSGVFAGSIERSNISVAFLLSPMLGRDWEQDVTGVVIPLGWYITRKSILAGSGLFEFCIEPTSQEPVTPGVYVYHASPREHRGLIEAQGLTVSASSTTWTNRRYLTPRVHVAGSLEGALTYIESRATGIAALEGITRIGAKVLQSWDVQKVRTGTETYYRDAEMGGSLWCETAIPPDRVHRQPAILIRLAVELKLLKKRWALK